MCFQKVTENSKVQRLSVFIQAFLRACRKVTFIWKKYMLLETIAHVTIRKNHIRKYTKGKRSLAHGSPFRIQ